MMAENIENENGSSLEYCYGEERDNEEYEMAFVRGSVDEVWPEDIYDFGEEISIDCEKLVDELTEDESDGETPAEKMKGEDSFIVTGL